MHGVQGERRLAQQRAQARSCQRGGGGGADRRLLQGTTTILLTEVPHFRELAVYSFECPHCGNRCSRAQLQRLTNRPLHNSLLSRPVPAHRNNEVQFAGAFGEQGVRYALSVPEGAADALSRQVRMHVAGMGAPGAPAPGPA